jgi:hypothetical protein
MNALLKAIFVCLFHGPPSCPMLYFMCELCFFPSVVCRMLGAGVGVLRGELSEREQRGGG